MCCTVNLDVDNDGKEAWEDAGESDDDEADHGLCVLDLCIRLMVT